MKSNTPFIVLGTVIATLLIVLIVVILTKTSIPGASNQKYIESGSLQQTNLLGIEKAEAENLALEEFRKRGYDFFVADEAVFIAEMKASDAVEYLNKIKASVEQAYVISSTKKNDAWHVYIAWQEFEGPSEVIVYSKDNIKIPVIDQEISYRS